LTLRNACEETEHAEIFYFSCHYVAVAFVSPQPAGAFIANADGVAKAATATNPIIEVKRSPHKSRPPGWSQSHGRKVGWHGRNRPPGQP
jgi:hypothetical protein